MTCDYNRFDGGHCVRTGHRKMAVLGMADYHDGNREIPLIVWSFKGLKLFASCETSWQRKRVMGFMSWGCLKFDWTLGLWGKYQQLIAQVGVV